MDYYCPLVSVELYPSINPVFSVQSKRPGLRRSPLSGLQQSVKDERGLTVELERLMQNSKRETSNIIGFDGKHRRQQMISDSAAHADCRFAEKRVEWNAIPSRASVVMDGVRIDEEPSSTGNQFGGGLFRVVSQ